MTKKRKAGRPKADRLDKPKPLTIQLAGKAVAASIDAPMEELDTPAEDTVTPEEEVTPEETEEEVETPKISHKFHTAPEQKTPVELAKQAEVKVRKRLQDIVPSAPAEVESEEIMAPSADLKKTQLPLSDIISSSWSEPWQGGPARILIMSAVISALLAGTTTYMALFYFSTFTNFTVIAGFGAIIIAIALLFGVANTERAAFALRRYDHRPIPRSWLFGGALAVLARQTIILVVGLIDIAVLSALAWYVGQTVPHLVVQPYGAITLLGSYFVLTLLLLGAWVKMGLGSAGVELGRMKALEAMKFGLSSLWRHPELMGTRLVSALWLAASLSGVIAVAYLIHLYVSGFDTWILVAGASILAFTAALLGNFGAVGWRQASYRELVIVDEPNQAIAMLSGHHNGAPRRSVAFIFAFVVAVLILGGITAILSSFYR